MVKADLKADDTTEATLLKLIKADASDLSSKNKLRLMRIVSNLCCDGILMQLATPTVAGRPVEALQFKLFGHQRSRPSLADMLDPIASPVILCQSDLLPLLEEFGVPQWQILDRVGEDFADDGLRKIARREVLQLAAGVHEMFSSRMSVEPCRLGWLALDCVSPSLKRSVARQFLQVPEPCLSFFCKQLRRLCPTEEKMLAMAPAIVRAWMLSAVLAVDACERAHSQLRRDLAPQGPACGLAAAVNRSFCRQAAAEHIFRGGADPAKHLASTLVNDNSSSIVLGGQARRQGGSNPFMEFHNFRTSTLKSVMAPRRALTADERTGIEHTISEEWAVVLQSPTELELWRDRFHARRACPPLPPPGADAGVVAESSRAFGGVWGNTDRNWLMAPGRLVDITEASPGIKRRPTARVEDERVFVQEPPARKASLRGGWGSLYGCKCHVKPICRLHGLDAQTADALDKFTHLLNSWAASLDKELRDNV